MKRWQIQEAKARLSELIKLANNEPQEISVRGKPTAVILSKKQYLKLAKPKISFVDLVRKSPLLGSELDLERNKSQARNIKF